MMLDRKGCFDQSEGSPRRPSTRFPVLLFSPSKGKSDSRWHSTSILSSAPCLIALHLYLIPSRLRFLALRFLARTHRIRLKS